MRRKCPGGAVARPDELANYCHLYYFKVEIQLRNILPALLVCYFNAEITIRNSLQALCSSGQCAESPGIVYMRNSLGWLETRLAQNTLNYLKQA